MKGGKFGWGLMVLGFWLVLTGIATAGEVSASLDATWVSRYVWRGMPVNDDPVFQPAVTLAAEGLSFNIWGNMDTTDWGEKHGGYGDKNSDFTEVDYSAGYERSIGPVKIGAGFINYTFPHTGVASTAEVYGKIGANVWAAPTLTCFVDEGVAEGANYLSLDLGQSWELVKLGSLALGLDAAAHLAWANEKFNRAYYGLSGDGFNDWSAGIALPLKLPYGFTFKPLYQHSELLQTDCRDLVTADDGWGRKSAGNDIWGCDLNWSTSF